MEHNLLGMAPAIRKLRTACHYSHFFKNSEMKPISKSHLRIEIYTFQEIMSTDQLLAPARNRHRAVILALPLDKTTC